MKEIIVIAFIVFFSTVFYMKGYYTASEESKEYIEICDELTVSCQSLSTSFDLLLEDIENCTEQNLELKMELEATKASYLSMGADYVKLAKLHYKWKK